MDTLASQETSHALQTTWVFKTTPLLTLRANDSLQSMTQKGKTVPAENLKRRTN